jgi:hypothetical protein
MSKAKPKWGWKADYEQLPELPEETQSAIRHAMLDLLADCPDGERQERADDVIHSVHFAWEAFVNETGEARGPTVGEVKAALLEIHSRLDKLVVLLDRLDDVSAIAVTRSNKAIRSSDTKVSLKIADQFKGVWDLQAALSYALRELDKPKADDRRWCNMSYPVGLMGCSIMSSREPFVSALEGIAWAVYEATGKSPSAYWDNDTGQYEGTFLPLVQIFARLASPERSHNPRAWPASAAEVALKHHRSWIAELEILREEEFREHEAKRQAEEDEARRAAEEE